MGGRQRVCPDIEEERRGGEEEVRGRGGGEGEEEAVRIVLHVHFQLLFMTLVSALSLSVPPLHPLHPLHPCLTPCENVLLMP